MNKKLLYILLALVMVCSVALTACNLTPAKVTITYKYNYEGAPADKTVTLDKGANITLDTPTRTDYKFDGWFTDAACTKAFTDKVANANVTLYAKWTASHTHDLHYQSSSSKHWQECSCGYTTEQVDHTFDANNTCVCGYKQGGTAHTHSWATDWSKDATNHWHVCTGCSELNDKAAHDTNGTDGACSVCGYKAQAQGQAVTVYFYTADWTTVNAYAWTDTPSFAEHLGGWPGTAINAVAGEEGWYSVEVPADTQKIIFNDGSKQTNDLLITDGPYFVGSNGYATKAEAEEALSTPAVTTYTLKGGFDNWGAGLAFESHEEGQVKLLGVELEAGVQFKVYITDGQTEEWISAIESGVTVATNVMDESGNENITVAETGVYDLYFKIEAKQLYVAKVVEEHEHVASETLSKDATGHWYACTTCSAVIEGSFAEHDTEGEEGACSVCGWVTPVEPEKVTLYYYTTTWTAVYAYAWTANEDKPLGEWPGTAINAVAGEEGWYSVEVPVDAQNIIFNNNDGAQTADLLISDGPYFFGISGAAKTMEEANESISKPAEEVTLYYYTTEWTAVYAYTWTPEALGTWPGTQATTVEGETGWYSIEVPAETVNILFNIGDDSAKTSDLLVANGPYFVGNTGYATKEEAEAALSAPDTWTVAGTAGLCGTEWDTTNADNDMTYDSEKEAWVKTYTGIAAGEHKFKVVKNHLWDEAYPAQDYVLNVATDDATVTIVLKGQEVTVEVIEKEHEHVASETYSSDATGHWYACTTCSAVIEGSFAEHDTEGEEGACSVCGWVTPAEPEKVTVYFQNNWLWTDVKAYYWTTEGENSITNAEWPGVAMTFVANDGTYDIYSVEVPVNVTGLIISGIKDDGSGTLDKTPDITIENKTCVMYYMVWEEENAVAVASYHTETTETVAEADCTNAGEKKHTCSVCGNVRTEETKALGHTFVEGVCSVCGEAEPTEEEKITVCFQNNWLWTEVKAYYWVGEEDKVFNAEWPGVDMTFVENDGSYDIYSIEVPVNVTGLIISGIKDDGSGVRDQSPDITTGLEDGVLFRMAWNDGNQVEVVCTKHTESESYSSDALNHWLTCVNCTAVLQDTIAAHDTNGENGVCSVCGFDPSQVVEATVLYLTPNANWKIDGARFAAYFFGNGEVWVDMTDEDGDGIYEVVVPEGFVNIIFCRMNPNATDNNWNNKWNQTEDLKVPTDGTNMYTVAEGTWDKGGGTWSTLPVAAE